MPPAISLAGPKKTFAAIDPFDVAAPESGLVPIDVAPRGIVPRFVFLSQDRTRFAGGCVGKKHDVCVLAAIELLDHDFVGAGGPLHPRQIVVSRITGNIDPPRWTTVRVHNANTSGGVCLTGLRIWECCCNWIKRGGVVDQRHLLRAFGVELPVRDLFAVGTPAETVTTEELFLVHPVECAVDDVLRAVSRQLCDLRIARKVLDVDVVFTNVTDTLPVRRELREHQARWFRVGTAEFLQRVRFEIEHPVIAPRIATPYACSLCEDQNLLLIATH